MTEMSRRIFVARTAGAATVVGALGAAIGASPAAAAGVPRAHGPLLTAGYDTFLQAIGNQAANLCKVVTGWGSPPGGWNANPDHVWTACGATDYLIVRTQTGDTNAYIDANQASAQVAGSRFFEYKRIRSGAGKCVIGLGNEPNAGNNLDPWVYGSLLGQTVDRMRRDFPGALICGTALSPNKGVNPDTWYANPNYRAAVNKCDFVGVHFYSNAANGGFTQQGSWNELTYAETLTRAASNWPGKPVIATEYSIRTTSISAYDKGYKYANLIHFDSTVRANLWGATYYHVQVDPGGVDFAENVGSDGARGYRARLTAGGL